MYDSHIYCKEYRGFKGMIVDMVNGDRECGDIDEIAEHIQSLYENGELQATQYDDLMRYVQDLV